MNLPYFRENEKAESQYKQKETSLTLADWASIIISDGN